MANLGFHGRPYIHAGINRMVIEDIYFEPFERISRSAGKVTTVSVLFGVGVKLNFGQSWILAAEVAAAINHE